MVVVVVVVQIYSTEIIRLLIIEKNTKIRIDKIITTFLIIIGITYNKKKKIKKNQNLEKEENYALSNLLCSFDKL